MSDASAGINIGIRTPVSVLTLCSASWALRAAFRVKNVTKQHPGTETERKRNDKALETTGHDDEHVDSKVKEEEEGGDQQSNQGQCVYPRAQSSRTSWATFSSFRNNYHRNKNYSGKVNGQSMLTTRTL